MSGLGGEDGGSNGDVGRVRDELSGTGVGGDTNVLEQSSERDEGLDICVWADCQQKLK